MNSPLSIKCSYVKISKIFVANFASQMLSHIFYKIVEMQKLKKFLENKSHFHSLVMNSPLPIKYSCEKIFVANFAFFKYYNIFFIKLQMKKPSTWIGSDMPGPRRAAHVSEKIVSVSGEKR